MIFIYSNQEITSFNTAKSVNDESANKLTTFKLIAYNSIMPTKIYDKIKVTGISMHPDLQHWRPNLWLNNRSLIWIKWTPQETRNQTTPHKTTNNKPPHLDDEIKKKKPRSMWNHLFRLKQREKDEEGWFQIKNWPKSTPRWRNWKRKPREKKLGPACWRESNFCIYLTIEGCIIIIIFCYLYYMIFILVEMSFFISTLFK